jgi:hypothetical protein
MEKCFHGEHHQCDQCKIGTSRRLRDVGGSCCASAGLMKRPLKQFESTSSNRRCWTARCLFLWQLPSRSACRRSVFANRNGIRCFRKGSSFGRTTLREKARTTFCRHSCSASLNLVKRFSTVPITLFGSGLRSINGKPSVTHFLSMASYSSSKAT